MDQSYQVHVKPRWGSEATGTCEALLGTMVNRSTGGQGVEQSHQEWVRPRLGPDSPDPGEAQVVTRDNGSGRGPGKDQIHQVQETNVKT